jgi:hypothetical protein
MNVGSRAYRSSSRSWKTESLKKKFSSVMVSAAVVTGIAGLGLVDVEVVVDAVLPGVGALVDVAVAPAALEQVLDDARVLGAGGALEMVDLQPELAPLPLEFGGDEVAVVSGRLSNAPGRALDVDPVLVRAGGQHRLVALQAFEAAHDVRNDGRVGVANVRRGVDVIDGSGQVVLHRDCAM